MQDYDLYKDNINVIKGVSRIWDVPIHLAKDYETAETNNHDEIQYAHTDDCWLLIAITVRGKRFSNFELDFLKLNECFLHFACNSKIFTCYHIFFVCLFYWFNPSGRVSYRTSKKKHREETMSRFENTGNFFEKFEEINTT